MCGFIGCFVRFEKDDLLLSESLKMLAHRGPDHSRFIKYSISNGFLYFGHTRLSIIDLSDNSSQPFNSICGGYSIIFNGEIYNYKEIRDELISLGYIFESESDTEVLLYSLIEWGTNSLTKFIGMFSFVFYDKKKSSLTLVRDAFGIKPFFYNLDNGEIFFSSELAALVNLRDRPISPNLQRAYDYLIHGDYDSNDDSFIDGVKHLPPAHFVKFDLVTATLSKPICWWKPDISQTKDISFDEASQTLKELYLDSIKLHLRSDAPLGVALSGGLDSSSIAAAVRYLSPNFPIKTFSYIANDKKLSEEYWVDLLNEKINAESHKVFADEKEMKCDLHELIQRQGEPFGSTSIYAQFRVFKLARERGITVTLDGQGADELLAGYSGYPGNRVLSLIETKGFLSAHKYIKAWSRHPGRDYFLAWKYFFRIITPNNIYALVRKFTGRDFQPKWLKMDYLSKYGLRYTEKRAPLKKVYKGKRVREALVYALSNRGLPSLLRHGDRNSMASSIESRVPFLTIPLAEFLLSLPEEYLISADGTTKSVFREAMRGIVPDSHLDRKDKIGFATPESNWLINMSGDIREIICMSDNVDFIDKDLLLSEFDQHVKCNKVLDKRFWRIMNYLCWYELFFSRKSFTFSAEG